MGANKPATTTTVQTKSPWATTADQLSGIANTTGNLASNTSLWAPSVSNQTQQGIGQLAALGNSGPTAGNQLLSGVTNGSQAGFETGLGQLQNIAGGAYVNNNPYLAAALKPALDDTQNRVNSQFTAAGRYGSGDHASELARQLGNTEAQAYQSNYTTQLGQQQAAATSLNAGGYQGAGLAGALDTSSTLPSQYNLQSGTLQDTLANQTKQAPINALNWQNSIISPMSSQYGSSNTNSTTVQPTNPLTQALGIGQMGLGLLTGNPMLMMNGAGSTFGGGNQSGNPYGNYGPPNVMGSQGMGWG